MSRADERRKRPTHRRQVIALGGAVRRLGWNLLLYHSGEAQKMGLNPTDSRAMSHLSESGPMPAGRLAELMGLTTGAVTGLLDRLEGVGLVRRQDDPQDRRRVLIVPVPSADEEVEAGRLFGPLEQPFGALVRSYSEGQLAVILDFIERTSELLRAQTEAALRQEVEAGEEA
jgi:DNA-binding MarR family transcriptional regulator